MKKSNKSKLDFLPNRLNKFSIRKFSSVGTASILIGSLVFTGSQASAATDDTATTEAATTEAAAEATYSISGSIFDDLQQYDANGNYLAANDNLRGANETLLLATPEELANFKVVLKNGAGEIVETKSLDASGAYSFSGLKNGVYHLDFQNPLTWSPVIANIDNNAHDANDSDGPTGVRIEIKDANVTNVDQGFASGHTTKDMAEVINPTPTTEAPTTEAPTTEAPTTEAPTTEAPVKDTGDHKIAGRIFDDLLGANGEANNNLRDENESLVLATPEELAAFKVELRDEAGNVVAEKSLDATGYYEFTGLKNGTYNVTFKNPLTWSPVIANVDFDASDDRDSDGPTDVRVVINNNDSLHVDQGYKKGAGHSVNDLPDTEAPTTEAPTTEAPTTEAPTTEAPTTEAPTTEAPTTEAPAKGKYSLGDKVWEDKLEEDTKAPNNVQDADEKGIEGIKVTLHDYAGNFVGETYTDANGQYRFDNLPNGTYRVDFDTPLGWSPVIANLGDEVIDSDGPVAVLADINGKDNLDVDQGYVNNGGGGVVTPVPTPDPGKPEPTPEPTPDPVRPEGKYSIGDKVWWDDQDKEGNLDNLQDPNEAPVKDLKVTIRDEAGNLIGTTYTDANGHYQFDNLPNGTYIVNFHNPLDWSPVIANLEADLHDVIDSDGPTDVRVVINGASNFDVDQGYVLKTGSPVIVPPGGGGEVTPPVTPPGGGGEVTPPTKLPLPPEVCSVVSIGEGAAGNLSIGNKVWWDANRNNMQDAGENPVVGLRVTLRDYSGNTIGETYTNAWGEYAFHGLAEGTYIVNFHNPLDWSPVIANIEADLHDEVDSDGPIDVIVNLKDKSNANVDQGYYGTGEAGPNCDTGITPPGDNGGGDKDPGTKPGDNGGGDKDPGTKPGDNGGGDKDPGTKPGDNGGGDDKTPVTPPTDGGGDDKTPVTPPTDGAQLPDVKDSEKATVTPDSNLPDTGEANNAAVATGAAAALLAGGALIAASRKRRDEEI
ncbi:SdrD B-like domain-containing protein [Macrococcus sp. PK]|uniref:SdrD B-like domain-containing protein n=1 Tax=Macrococcus sp. PK TaxID=2801919 RepID=UPI001FDCF6A7|nr:SdrD B-like domain-containing protein [Macrococcus sp. PK]MCH4985402.1 carboxypeptidase regulatory-like domain-containing protein [Macrococcus sp. PK]